MYFSPQTWEESKGVIAYVDTDNRPIIQGLLPSLILIVALALVPPIMLAIAKTEGSSRSKTELEKRVAGYLFYFYMFSIFLGSVASSTILASVSMHTIKFEKVNLKSILTPFSYANTGNRSRDSILMSGVLPRRWQVVCPNRLGFSSTLCWSRH